MHYLKYKEIFNRTPIEIPAVKMGGRWRCILRDSKTEKVIHDTGWFHNLILDQGLGYFTSQSNWASWMYIGDDGSAANRLDVGCKSILAGDYLGGNSGAPNTTYTSNETYPGLYQEATVACRYDESVVGTVRELSINLLNSPTGGSVRTVVTPEFVKTNQQVLDVYYQIRQSRDGLYGPYNGQIDISGVTYNYEITGLNLSQNINPITQHTPWTVYSAHAAYAGEPNPERVLNNSYPSGALSYCTSNPTLGSWSVDGPNGIGTRDYQLFWDLNGGNIGGIRTVTTRWNGAGSGVQIRLENASDLSAVPKDATKRFYLDCRISWTRQ